MKKTGKKLLTLVLAAVMLLGLAAPVLAADPIDYAGDEVDFIKENGDGFGMFTRMDGTSIYIINDDVIIHYVTKSNVRSSDQSLVYTSLHWGAITDTLTQDVPANADGSFDITLPKTNCGKAIPVAPVKPDGGTTSSQYYLAIPAASKLEDRTPAVTPFAYDGNDVTFIKENGDGFGMFTRMDGTTAVINGDNVVIHYVTKSNVRSSDQSLVYTSLHWGAITDTLTQDVPANADGSFDITLPKTNCGKAIPVAPVKPDGGTTSSQYYLAIPAADKLTDVTPVAAPFAYDGNDVTFIKENGDGFGMFTRMDGTTAVINGDNVVIHYVTKSNVRSSDQSLVYTSLHWGAITDTLTQDVPANADGSFDITLPKTNCGKAIPVAPVKPDGGTTSSQYYLAIPAADKLTDNGSDEGGSNIALTISAFVTISKQGELVTGADGSTVAAAPVLATDLDNSGDVTIDEVLTAAHEAYYPGGASAGYASSVGSWGLGMDMLWGDTSYNFGYYVDNAMAWSLADTVKDGGHVQAWVYQDAEYYSDAYAYFDKLSAEAADGTVTLTLIASQGYDETTYAPIFAPYAGASVTVDGQATGLVTDSQGKVTLSFDASGTYLISAAGKDSDILVPPVSLISASVTIPQTISATVTISKQGELVTGADGTAVAAAVVQVTDLNNDGIVSIDEVLTAAHEEFYPGGAQMGYHAYVSQYGLGIDKLWGVETTGVGYYVNNASAWSLDDPVQNGDYVCAFVYKDTDYWSDSYSYFDKLTTRALSGSITLTLYSASYDENWNVVFAPYADAAVTIDGKATGLVTDSQGKVTLTFDESGTYLVSAAGKDGEILVPPVSLVTATVSSGSQDSRIDLEITNNTGMFKGEYAYVETVDGVSTLVVALTGQTYRYLIPGTYAQAVNNGTDRSSWIAGQQDENGKWFFRIPLRSGQTYIPVVSVSQTYLDKYEAGENPLERSYYPRQFELDMDAGTLTIGDYDTNIRFSVLSDLSTFQATSSTMVHVVGGPNSNNYSLSFSLKVMDGTYDQVTYPTVVDGAISEATASLSGGAFAIEIKNAPTLTAFQDRTPIQMSFRLAETGNDTVIPVTIDLLAQTITIGSYSGSASGSSDSQAPQIVTADLTVSAEVINGTAEAVLSAETVTAAIEKEQEADVLAVYVESKGADTVELTLDNLAVKVVAGTNTALSVETEQGTLTVSKDEMEKLSKAGGDVALSLSVNKDGSMTLDVTANGKTADVTVKAALPAVEGSQVLVLVKEDGTEEVIRKSLVEDGTAYANLPAGCTVKAVDGSMEFEDVSDTNWFAHYVDFVSSHRLFTGVTETEFKPGEPMTRAMLAMVLFRLESEPENASAGSIKFDDVKDDSWYADAVDWAAGFGVFVGRENGFAPNASITRQEMATALYRYVKALGLDTETKGSLENYNDGSSVASWAQDAMTWAVGVGLFEGDDTGSLNPGSNATRAEVAALTARLVKLLVK